LQRLLVANRTISQRFFSSQSQKFNIEALQKDVQICKAEIQEMNRARQRTANVAAISIFFGAAAYLYCEHDAEKNKQDDLPINITY
jgi:hypothetical protein